MTFATPADHFTTADAGTPLALAAEGVTKRFPGVVANDRVDFGLRAHEIHALLGENGSGKTTLCKILTGLYQPDEGRILVDGRPVQLGSPAEAYAAGVFMVHQHFSLVERMTVAENVVLGWSQAVGVRFRRADVEATVAEAAERFHMHVDPSRPVWQLSVGERQRVEILKALYRGARTLILDEPTTVLTPQEADQLFLSLRRMAEHGQSVVFISHKLHEVVAVCDRVTVLQQGRTSGVVDLRAEKVDRKRLAEMMVGREIELSRRPERSKPLADNPVLVVDDVVVRNEYGREVVKGVSFDVHAGEILAVAGVAGNGQRELSDAIFGLLPRASGRVEVAGVQLASGDCGAAIRQRLAYVPEDRLGVGLAPGLDASENVILKAFRMRRFGRWPMLRLSSVREYASELLERFNVKGGPDSLIRQLSGGNAQKVLLARELSSDPRVIVAASPTRGLDVSAMESVREILLDAAAHDVAVVLVSEDLEEILDLADRVVVMCEGRVTGVVDARSTSVEQIGILMMGHSEPT